MTGRTDRGEAGVGQQGGDLPCALVGEDVALAIRAARAPGPGSSPPRGPSPTRARASRRTRDAVLHRGSGGPGRASTPTDHRLAREGCGGDAAGPTGPRRCGRYSATATAASSSDPNDSCFVMNSMIRSTPASSSRCPMSTRTTAPTSSGRAAARVRLVIPPSDAPTNAARVIPNSANNGAIDDASTCRSNGASKIGSESPCAGRSGASR